MIKKFTLVVSTLLVASLTTFAQVRVGVTGGVQLANQKNEIGGFSLSGSNRIGFTAGLVLDAALSESFSIRPQVLYSVKGMKLNFDALLGGLGGNDAEGTYTFNYVEVPIQLMYGVEAGPALNTENLAHSTEMVVLVFSGFIAMMK
ncbi:porin family protein [Spirosoma soli]|uniref:Porin family protein n=1 Tax=Spirosoma soli TaxID=1770529 RepID=A0ABW5M5P8_9BACT